MTSQRLTRRELIQVGSTSLMMVGGALLQLPTAAHASELTKPAAELRGRVAADAGQIGPFDTGYITFQGGTPVGGFANITLFPNGSYTFGGHLHVSGATSYDVSFVWAFKSAANVVYTFTQKGHLAGTFEPGSRDFDWGISAVNPALAAGWADLSRSWSWRWSTAVNLDISPLVSDVTKAMGVVSAVIAIV